MIKKINIIIIDDDPMVGESLEYLLTQNEDMHIIGSFEGPIEALETMSQLKLKGNVLPDVVLMDIQMPVMDGIEATGIIRRDYPQTHVMMLTTFKDEHRIKRALMAGAEGYLIKSSEVETMAVKIRALVSGSIIMDQQAIEEITNPKFEELEGLTPRETSIVFLIGQGFSNKEISQQLFISEGTVRNNLSVILEKLELRDRTQLAIMYLKNSNNNI